MVTRRSPPIWSRGRAGGKESWRAENREERRGSECDLTGTHGATGDFLAVFHVAKYVRILIFDSTLKYEV